MHADKMHVVRGRLSCVAQPKEMGLPTTAYYSADEIREVRSHVFTFLRKSHQRAAQGVLCSLSRGAVMVRTQDGTQKSQKVFVNIPTEVGATEAEEIGGWPLPALKRTPRSRAKFEGYCACSAAIALPAHAIALSQHGACARKSCSAQPLTCLANNRCPAWCRRCPAGVPTVVDDGDEGSAAVAPP